MKIDYYTVQAKNFFPITRYPFYTKFISIILLNSDKVPVLTCTFFIFEIPDISYCRLKSSVMNFILFYFLNHRTKYLTF